MVITLRTTILAATLLGGASAAVAQEAPLAHHEGQLTFNGQVLATTCHFRNKNMTVELPVLRTSDLPMAGSTGGLTGFWIYMDNCAYYPGQVQIYWDGDSAPRTPDGHNLANQGSAQGVGLQLLASTGSRVRHPFSLNTPHNARGLPGVNLRSVRMAIEVRGACTTLSAISPPPIESRPATSAPASALPLFIVNYNAPQSGARGPGCGVACRLSSCFDMS